MRIGDLETGPHFMDAAQQRAWRKKNPARVREYNRRAVLKYGRRPLPAKWFRAYHLKRKYGLTAAAWDALFDAQGGRCASCGVDRPFGKYWHTDHVGPLPCTPAEVRGILCSKCNHAIGQGGYQDAVRLAAQLNYVQEHLP